MTQELETALLAAEAKLKNGKRGSLLSESSEVEIPSPAYGESENLAYASAAVELRYSCVINNIK